MSQHRNPRSHRQPERVGTHTNSGSATAVDNPSFSSLLGNDACASLGTVVEYLLSQITRLSRNENLNRFSPSMKPDHTENEESNVRSRRRNRQLWHQQPSY